MFGVHSTAFAVSGRFENSPTNSPVCASFATIIKPSYAKPSLLPKIKRTRPCPAEARIWYEGNEFCKLAPGWIGSNVAQAFGGAPSGSPRILVIVKTKNKSVRTEKDQKFFYYFSNEFLIWLLL